MSNKTLTEVMREHKNILIIIGIVLFLVELEIFAIAAMKSGRRQYLQVIDSNGNMVYETDGKSLSDFNKYYFEKTFGPLDQFEKRMQVREMPFPFRAWFTAAVGIPVGLILLFAFVVKAYIGLFHEENKEKEDEKSSDGTPAKPQYDNQFEKILGTIGSLNIFTIGFIILLVVLMYWVIPNAVTYIGRVSLDTLIRFKWVVLGVAIVLMGLFVWVVYLRYLLAKRAIDQQAELQKVRLQLEFNQEVNLSAPRLEYKPEQSDEPVLVGWTEGQSQEANIRADESAENN